MDKTKVIQVIENAKTIRIKGLDFVLSFGIDEICKAYNGIGPQFLPEDLRDKVTNTLHIFEPAALVHDLRFEQSDGTREAFDRANAEFVVNCRKCARHEYAWYNWKRYRAHFIIKAMNAFNCGDGGWKAWNDACESKGK